MHTDDGDQLPLFPQPDDVAIPRARRRPPGTARYAKYRPKRRTLCGDCTRDIHERGQGVAPYPRPVSWRRVDATTGAVDLLCDAHYRYRKGES